SPNTLAPIRAVERPSNHPTIQPPTSVNDPCNNAPSTHCTHCRPPPRKVASLGAAHNAHYRAAASGTGLAQSVFLKGIPSPVPLPSLAQLDITGVLCLLFAVGGSWSDCQSPRHPLSSSA